MPKHNRSATAVDAHVGAMVRHFRIVHLMSQEQLAGKLGVTFQQVQKYEKGTNRISASRLVDLCRVFNVTPNDFFAGIDGVSTSGTEAPALATDRQSLEVMRRFSELPPKAKNVLAQTIFSVRNLLVEEPHK